MNKLFLSLVVLVLSLPSAAFAADVSCVGEIEDWELTRSGYLYVDGTWNGTEDSQRFCSVHGKFDNISAEVCKIWASTVMGASMGGGRVKLKYKDVASCSSSSLGVWSKTIKAPETIRSYRF